MTFEVMQERDRVPLRAIVWVTLVVLVVSVVAVWGAARLGGDATRFHAHVDIVSDTPAEREGVVEQSLIDHSQVAARLREHAEARLSSYGWADRAHQRAHVPIDRAIDLYLSSQRGSP
jgi:hypothetical protein